MAKCEKCGVKLGPKSWVKCKLCEASALTKQLEGVAEMVSDKVEYGKTLTFLDKTSLIKAILAFTLEEKSCKSKEEKCQGNISE